MWALRRAATSLRSHGCRLGASRACCSRTEILSDDLEDGVGICDYTITMSGSRCISPKRLYHSSSVHTRCFRARRGLSFEAGEKSSGREDDLEDGFSDLGTPPSIDTLDDNNTKEDNDELVSDSEVSEDDFEKNSVETSHIEFDWMELEVPMDDIDSHKKRDSSGLFKVVIGASSQFCSSALDKWVEERNVLSRSEISMTILNLRKRRMYFPALQFFEWLEANKKLNFVERDYAYRIDLIAKVCGYRKAEKYIEMIPESFRGKVIYGTLLAVYVATGNMKKAEELFNKMKELEFPITVFACNQLLLLYKRIDMKKIADVLLLMVKENVKPSLATYRLLIDAKGRCNDISGMEQVLETMKAEGFELDIWIQAIIAQHYINSGLDKKAEVALKEMEGSNLKENRGACKELLRLYAALGKADEVERVWRVCEPKPRLREFLAAIEAWGNLKRIEEAEAVFERMIKERKKLSSWYFTPLLKVYTRNKLFSPGKDLANWLEASGCHIGPVTWDALVKLYVEAGEVEKADLILHKAAQRTSRKPLFSSYLTIMEQYVKRGDVHNAENIFFRTRQLGYFRPRLYQALLQAYLNSKAPAYGFRERMEADNMFPNKSMSAQLAQVDAFRETAISYLLD